MKTFATLVLAVACGGPLMAQNLPSPVMAPGSILRPAASQAADREAAIDIARQRGMTELKAVELSNGVWEVKGANKTGVKMEVIISANDGRVLNVDFGHPSPRRLGQ
jgi:uncharacterized membrane protein YkoI